MDLYNLLLSNYITYDRLYAMSSKALYGERVDKGEINLFIDINSFTKRIWDMQFDFKNTNVITASLINACAHYRNYFWTRHMCKTNIYLVWGWNFKTYFDYPNYNIHFRKRVATKDQSYSASTPLINSMREQLAFICPYLPQIYFIDGDINEVSVMIYSLASTVVKQNIPNIIVSKDIYSYQLVSYRPSTFVYRPKKSYPNNQLVDSSWVVTKSNLYKAFRYSMGYTQQAPDTLSHRDLSLVLSVSGLTKRHVKGLTTFNRACNIVNQASQLAPPNGLDIYSLNVIMSGELGMNTVTQEGLNIVSIYNILDVAVNCRMMQNTTPISISIKASIIDKYDPNGIMDLANKEFDEYPLELGEL